MMFSWASCLMPVIPAVQEVDIRRLPGQES
jgi:hypothetical protein